jgi:nitrite reductase/ring-hydroxylating ferredoxin subunit
MDDGDLELHTVPPDRGDMDAQPRWRQDFPIDTTEEYYLARRDFTKFLVLTSFAFVVGQFWIALRSVWRKARGTAPLVRIVPLDELPVGGAVAFRYPTDHDPALLVRTAAGTLVAYASQCTHLQCPVLPQTDADRLHCPCHAGYFDLATGNVLAGPPRRRLPRIQLEVRNGVVYATGVEEDLT